MISEIPSTAYGWLMLAGIFTSIFLWSRLIRRDDRLVLVYVAALTGAFLGAKLVYLGAEGWLHWRDPNRWVILATGKSITGALLGGYAAVEIAKRLLKYNGVTGDWFAIIVPAGVMIGRIGCMINGCCLGRACDASWFTINDVHGVARWPSSQMEFIFNAVMLGVILFMRGRVGSPLPAVVQPTAGGAHGVTRHTNNYLLASQHFHIYLMAYGIFRFFHEFLRDTPQIVGPISGYQIAALGIFFLGAVGFVRRRQLMLKPA